MFYVELALLGVSFWVIFKTNQLYLKTQQLNIRTTDDVNFMLKTCTDTLRMLDASLKQNGNIYNDMIDIYNKIEESLTRATSKVESKVAERTTKKTKIKN